MYAVVLVGLYGVVGDGFVVCGGGSDAVAGVADDVVLLYSVVLCLIKINAVVVVVYGVLKELVEVAAGEVYAVVGVVFYEVVYEFVVV